MKLAIVAYPNLDEVDRQWIESFRTKHDPQASRLSVHFTLVFPVVAVPSELEQEIAMVAELTQPISFTIRGTKVVRDVLGNGSHIFLVPDEGGAQISTLHGRLYAGALRTHLRSDIPYLPHMTVGAVPDSQFAERLAEELGVGSRMVRGMVANMELVDVGAPRVRSITTYALGNAAGTSG
jgi:2'-5' RNA ligase